MAYTPPAVPYYGPVVHFIKGSNLPPGRIVIHCTAGPGQVCAKGAQGTAKYFQDPKSGGSAHYITDLDETIQCAHDDVICWHAPPNPNSLGIEMECSLAGDGQGHWTRPDHITMMHRTARLTAQKAIQYGIPIVKLSVADLQAGKHGITGHAEVSKAFHQSDHTDPGPYFPWPQFMTWVHEEAALITGGTPTPAPEVWNMATGDEILKWLKDDAATAGTSGQRYAALQNSLNAVGGVVNAVATAVTALGKSVVALDTQNDADAVARQNALKASLAQVEAELQALQPPKA